MDLEAESKLVRRWMSYLSDFNREELSNLRIKPVLEEEFEATSTELQNACIRMCAVLFLTKGTSPEKSINVLAGSDGDELSVLEVAYRTSGFLISKEKLTKLKGEFYPEEVVEVFRETSRMLQDRWTNQLVPNLVVANEKHRI